MNILLVLSSLITIILICKINGINFKVIKNKKVAIITFFILFIIIFSILNNIDKIYNTINISEYKFISEYTLLLSSICLAVYIYIISASILNTIKNFIYYQVQKHILKNKYDDYEEILKKINPFIFIFLYKKKFNKIDLIILELLYLKNNNMLDDSTYEFDKLLFSFLKGSISNSEFNKKYKARIIHDLKKDTYLHENIIDSDDNKIICTFIISFMLILMLQIVILMHYTSTWLMFFISYFMTLFLIVTYKLLEELYIITKKTDKGLKLNAMLATFKYKILNDKINQNKENSLTYILLFQKDKLLNSESVDIYNNLYNNLTKKIKKSYKINLNLKYFILIFLIITCMISFIIISINYPLSLIITIPALIPFILIIIKYYINNFTRIQ